MEPVLAPGRVMCLLQAADAGSGNSLSAIPLNPTDKVGDLVMFMFQLATRSDSVQGGGIPSCVTGWGGYNLVLHLR